MTIGSKVHASQIGPLTGGGGGDGGRAIVGCSQ